MKKLFKLLPLLFISLGQSFASHEFEVFDPRYTIQSSLAENKEEQKLVDQATYLVNRVIQECLRNGELNIDKDPSIQQSYKGEVAISRKSQYIYCISGANYKEKAILNASILREYDYSENAARIYQSIFEQFQDLNINLKCTQGDLRPCYIPTELNSEIVMD